MKEHNDGKSDISNTALYNQLLHLQRNTNLNNPEAVKDFIANKNGSENYKLKLCLAYNKYAKYYKINWTIPKYHPRALLSISRMFTDHTSYRTEMPQFRLNIQGYCLTLISLSQTTHLARALAHFPHYYWQVVLYEFPDALRGVLFD
jgi:hypothetical protein